MNINQHTVLLHTLNTYRKGVVGLILLIYVAALCPVPTLEVLHVLTHTQEWLQDGTHHAFHQHTDSHHHTHLEELADLSQPTSDNPQHFDPASDKKIEIIQPQIAVLDVSFDKPTAHFFFLHHHLYPDQEVSVPPPRNSFC